VEATFSKEEYFMTNRESISGFIDFGSSLENTRAYKLLHRRTILLLTSQNSSVELYHDFYQHKQLRSSGARFSRSGARRQNTTPHQAPTSFGTVWAAFTSRAVEHTPSPHSP
jgi:hypothetical protein